MLRSIGKEKKKRKAAEERICGKDKLQAWNKRVRGDGILITKV